MTKASADKLRAERDALLAKLRHERDDEAGCRAELERQIKTLQAQQAKKQSHLDACIKQTNQTLAELDRKITAAVQAEKKRELLEVAAQIDQAETPERWMRFDRLCTEITSNKQSYELRCMNRRRMTGEKEVAALGRPYPNVAAWATAMIGAL